MSNERSRRIADLFVEGEECFLGQDRDGKAVVVWVNKVNSFDSEDARRDGAVERGRRIAELSKPDNEEFVGLMAQVRTWDNERLADSRVAQQSDALSLAALDDLEADNRELVDRVRRGPELLDDAGVDEDDPKREAIGNDQTEYLRLMRELQARKFEEAKTKALELTREQLVDEFVEAWRERAAMEGFMTERRLSELHCAMRECEATIVEWDGPKPVFDHENCDHSKRWFANRRDVRTMPDEALDKIINIFDNLGASPREAGNLAAPASSSESSEQPSAPEDSTASTPKETSPAAPST